MRRGVRCARCGDVFASHGGRADCRCGATYVIEEPDHWQAGGKPARKGNGEVDTVDIPVNDEEETTT